MNYLYLGLVIPETKTKFQPQKMNSKENNKELYNIKIDRDKS